MKKASDTLVPEVFLELQEKPQSSKDKSQSNEKKKPPVTLNLNLTFMQMLAVKQVKLIITKGTNGNLAITCPLANDLPVCKNIQSKPEGQI